MLYAMTCISVAWDMGYIDGGSVLAASLQSGGLATYICSGDFVTIFGSLAAILWCVAVGWVKQLPTWCKVGTGVYTAGLGWDCIHILILILLPDTDSNSDSVT